MKTLTVAEAAKSGKCSMGALRVLIKKGKIKAERDGDKSHYRILQTKTEVKEIVNTEMRTHGYKKKNSIKLEKDTQLSSLINWIRFPEETRDILIRIGMKFPYSDLEILLSL